MRRGFLEFAQFSLFLSILFGAFPLRAGFENPEWNWQKTPERRHWQRFMTMGNSQQERLWKELEKRGLHFEQLSWEWRTGWIQLCAQSSSRLCGHLLQLGLFDRALVVRAEAAARIGERFAGTGQASALRLLATAYAVQQNKKGKDPLFVQYRILHAIKQIGGSKGHELGQKLANASPATARYWGQLAAR